MSDAAPEEFDALYARIREAYLSLGCPAEFLGRQAVPPRDAQDLVRAVRAARPRTIVEVGTFVGVSTMVLAASAGPGAVVHTVDPDPALDDQWASMRSGGAGSALAAYRTVQGVAAEAARRLGLAERIRFIRGGFSLPDTYASAEGAAAGAAAPAANPAAGAGVAGRTLLQQLGTVDLFFIDGLHYEFAALADMELAGRHLAPEGVMLLHDTTGMWGSNVRRAALRFVAANPGFHLEYPPLKDLYSTVGRLVRTSTAGATAPDAPAASVLDHADIAARAAAEAWRERAPGPLLRLGAAHPALESALARVAGVECRPVPLAGGPASPRAALLLVAAPECMGPVEPEAIARRCAELADAVVLAATPPGERGAALPWSAPRRRWVEAFASQGFSASERLSVAIEPLVGGGGAAAVALPESTALSTLLLCERRGAGPIPLSAAALDAHDRVEDLAIQAIRAGLCLQETQRAAESLQEWRGKDAARMADLDRQIAGLKEWVADLKGRSRLKQVLVRLVHVLPG